MKMSAEVYDKLKSAMDDHFKVAGPPALLVSLGKTQGHSEKRVMWDSFYRAKAREDHKTGAGLDKTGLIPRFIDIFNGLDEANIETALKKIFKEASQ